MKNTATRTFFIVSALIFMSVAAFGQRRTDLAGTEWKLTGANGKIVTNTMAAIEFNAAGTRFTGNTGCNQMSGIASIRGQQIDLARITTTRRACKLMAGSVPEETFLREIRQTTRYRVENRSLTFLDRRGRITLRFERTRGSNDNEYAAARLDNRKWMLEQIKNRRTLVAIRDAFLNFDESRGSAGGNSGCNVFGGDYSVNGNRITFSNIIGTMRACEEGGKMAVEREMLAGLRQASRFELRDGRLFLYRNRELLLTFRGERK